MAKRGIDHRRHFIAESNSTKIEIHLGEQLRRVTDVLHKVSLPGRIAREALSPSWTACFWKATHVKGSLIQDSVEHHCGDRIGCNMRSSMNCDIRRLSRKGRAQ